MVEKSYIRNGQSHFPADQTEALGKDIKKRKSKIAQRGLIVFYTILQFVICVGFVGFSYYLYERQNSEVQVFTEKINYLNAEIDHLKKKLDSLSSSKQNSSINIQNMLQESDSSKFKSIALDNIEEWPDMDDLDEDNLINNDEYQDDDTASDDLTDEAKTERSVEEIYNNYHPVNISLVYPERNNNTGGHQTKQSKLSKRSAQLYSPPNPRTQLVNNKSKYSNNNGLEPNAPDTLDLLNDNKKSNVKGVHEKKCTITIPLEDFVNHFKNYQHEDNYRIQEMLNKTNGNCSMVSVNAIRQNSNRRSKYNFKLRSSEEEDMVEHTSVESIVSNVRNKNRYFSRTKNRFNKSMKNNHEQFLAKNEERIKRFLKMYEFQRRKPEENRNSKLREVAWNKQLDVEILSENENDEVMHMQPRQTVPMAIHVGGRAINYDVGRQCYEGNGRLCHPTGETKDWVASNWVQEYKMHQHFTLNSGKLKVHKSGLYFVYSQILFSDINDYNGYYVVRNNEVVLQCTSNVPTLKTVLHNTCYTGGVIKCNENDVLSIKIDGHNRYITLVENMSYFGMFKVAETD